MQSPLINQIYYLLWPSPPWPSGLKRRNQTLVPVASARFEPGAGGHTLPLRVVACVFVAGAAQRPREREWAEGTVSSLYRAR